MQAKISLVQINVLNPSKAEEFYVNILGFEKDTQLSVPGVPVLKSEYGISILLYQAVEINMRNYPIDTGPLIVFEVEDILEIKNEWQRKGVQFIPSPWADENTGIAPCPFGEFIAFRDLDGNVHEIIQRHKN